MTQYLRTGLKKNTIDSLQKALDFLKKTDRNLYYWKWLCIALHNALYGFMICALGKGNWKNIAEWDKKRREYNINRLISFSEARKRVQDSKYICGPINATPITLTKSQRFSIKKLSEGLRNKFEHFLLFGWSIELSGMPSITKDVIDIIEQLAFNTGTVWWEESYEKRIKVMIKEIRKVIEEIDQSNNPTPGAKKQKNY